MKKNRSTLKEYFKKGAIPTDANFADLIDSMLNQEEDNLAKLPNDPLRITATGTDEALLNFYRTEKNEDKLSWQIKQKPGGKAGLSISEDAGNRLFVESGTGKVGLGTTTPLQTLDVRGRVNVDNGVIQRGGTAITNVSDLGLYSQVDKNWIRIVTTNAPIRFFTDGGIGTRMSLSVEADKVVVNGNLQLSGNNDFITQQGMLRMGTTDGSNTTSGKVVGAIGFWGFGVQHGQLSFRAGNGFELVDRSNDGPSLDYQYDAHTYADLKVRNLNATGNISSSGTLSLGSLQLKGFTAAETEEWPNVVWYRDTNANWDEGLIKHGPTIGKFKRAGFGIHFHQSREFGFFSTGWDPLFSVQGASGNTYVKGYLETKQAYFSAYLDSNARSGNLSPLPMQVVSQNIGNCYNTTNSTFTAPVKGVYLFTMTGLRVEGTDWLHWALMINGKTFANSINADGSSAAESGERSLLSWAPNFVGTSSRTIIVTLSANDTVSVQQSGSGRCDNYRSGLEGVLLFANLS